MAWIRTMRLARLLAAVVLAALIGGCSALSPGQATGTADVEPTPATDPPPPPPPPPAPAPASDADTAAAEAGPDAVDSGDPPDAGDAPDEQVYQSVGAAADEDAPDRAREYGSRGPAAAPTRDTVLPDFEPWPPPTPTSQDTIPRALVVGASAPTWGAVTDRFDAALAAAGYEDRAYYAVPGGFALATRIERIDREGRPLSEPTRWVGSRGRRAWTLESVLRELAGVPVGRYRTLVFVFSDTAFQSRPAAVSEAMAESWRTGGLNRLPAGLRATAYSERFQCDVLVYEFQQGSAGEAATFVEGGLSARRHLTAAQILDKLEAPR